MQLESFSWSNSTSLSLATSWSAGLLILFLLATNISSADDYSYYGDDEELSSEIDTAEGAENTRKIKLAKPKEYEVPSEKAFGVNEDGKGLTVGTKLSNVLLKNYDDQDYALAKAWRQKPALVVFYRGGWCPYCSFQVREMSLSYDRFLEAGVQPILISVDSVDRSLAIKSRYDIPFPVLSDPDLAAHEMFNVVLKLSKDNVSQMRIFGVDPTKWSERDHHSIAIASVFLVDTTGSVRFSHAPSNFRYRPSVDQLISFIERTDLSTSRPIDLSSN